jgi:hypothetical protein
MIGQQDNSCLHGCKLTQNYCFAIFSIELPVFLFAGAIQVEFICLLKYQQEDHIMICL